MKVLILGTGDAFTARHFGSSALVHSQGGAYVLIDCPDLIHRALREATRQSGWTVSALDIHDIIITHLHGDHSNGLESFGFHRRIALEQGLTDRMPRLHAAAEVMDRVWEKLAPAMDGPFMGAESSTLEDYFEPHILACDHPNRVADLTVDIRRTRHPVPTIGLRLKDGRGILGWSGDTTFEQAHIDWLSNADLIVHETNRGAAHTPIDRLAELPDEIRSRMRLIHMPDDFHAPSSPIPPLAEGEVLMLE